jgi:hypothetical protein
MTLSQAEKRAMIALTHALAWDMLEDLKHMREIIAKPTPTSAEVRRISSLVRRLLIDNGGDLPKISAPRLGRRLMLLAPDVHRAMEQREQSPVLLDSIGVSGVFGTTLERVIIGHAGIPFLPVLPPTPTLPRPKPGEYSFGLSAFKTDGEDKLGTISLRLDNFVSQHVLCFRGTWIRRGEIVKYVANVAGGVHSGTPKEAFEIVLHEVRQIGSFSSETGQGIIAATLNGPAIHRHSKNPLGRVGIDFVMQQVMAAARYVTISPDVIELEEIIKTEKVD